MESVGGSLLSVAPSLLHAATTTRAVSAAMYVIRLMEEGQR
jgi:hypothetical protein